MPIIREYQQSVGAAGPGAVQNIPLSIADSEAAGGKLVGAALSKTADVAYGIGEQIDKSQVLLRLANARADLTIELQKDVESGAAATPDFEKTFSEKAAKRLEKDQSGYHTGTGSQMAASGAAAISAEFRVQANQYQAVAVGQQAALGYKLAMDANKKTLLADPMQNKSVVEATLAALHDPNGSYAPRLGAQKTAELDRETRQELAMATMRGVVRTAGPEVALDMVKNGVGGSADLSAEQLRQLEAEAEQESRNRLIEDDRLQRRAEKDLQIKQEATMNDFIVRLNTPGGSTVSTREIGDSNLESGQKRRFFDDIKEGIAKPDPAVILKAFRDIHRPIGDPLKLMNRTELYKLYGRGADFAALNHLTAELELDPLGASMNAAEATAAAMITRGTIGSSAPEYAQSALYRWRLDFSAAFQKAIKEGRDPRTLIIDSPGNKDYMLSPQRIQSYVLDEFSLSGAQRTKVTDGLAAARVEMTKGGGALPPITTIEERDKLQPQTYYLNKVTGKLGFRP